MEIGKGLFDNEIKHKWLAKIITFKSPGRAKKAAERLIKALEKGKLGRMKIGRKRALAIDKALNYAANRAEAAAKKKKLSKSEKKQFKKIAQIYRNAQKKASKLYKERYK